MTFRKYQFVPSQWETLKAQIEQTTESPDGGETTSWNSSIVTAVVELGFLCEKWGTDEEGMPVCEVTSPLYAVDILWAGEPLASFVSSTVWPIPDGVHIIAGWEQAYATDYCVANPSAAYCLPPVPPTEE
jgi:hypothetical protein